MIAGTSSIAPLVSKTRSKRVIVVTAGNPPIHPLTVGNSSAAVTAAKYLKTKKTVKVKLFFLDDIDGLTLWVDWRREVVAATVFAGRTATTAVPSALSRWSHPCSKVGKGFLSRPRRRNLGFLGFGLVCLDSCA
jgi:hypothetical protein